ncbi:MAG: DUF1048 domain-containing protein [Sarcina sp.]
MSIKDIIEGKKQWKAHVKRVKSLPKDYQIVYEEIQKYLYKIGAMDSLNVMELLIGMVDLFEEGVVEGKKVLEVTGSDVATFCDELIKASNIHGDM